MNPATRFSNVVHVGHTAQLEPQPQTNIQSVNNSFLNSTNGKRSKTKEKGMREDMIHASNAFMELKRKNLSFLV